MSRSSATRTPLPGGTAVNVSAKSSSTCASSRSSASGMAGTCETFGLPASCWPADRATRRSPSRARRRRTRRRRRAPRGGRGACRRPRRCSCRSVTCWPTMGARFESNASMNGSSWRRVMMPRQLSAGMPGFPGSPGCVRVGAALGAKTVPPTKRKTVSTLPSCKKPKPRTWSPWKLMSLRRRRQTTPRPARADGQHEGVRHAEHADLLVQVAQVRDLEELRLVLERVAAVGPEEARAGSTPYCALPVRVEDVAAVAVVERVRAGAPGRVRPSRWLKKNARPAAWAGVSELSRLRIGFGG